MRTARPTIFAVAVVAAAVLAAVVAYLVAVQRQAQPAAAAIRPVPTGQPAAASPRPMGTSPPCACFAAATPAAPKQGTPVIIEGRGEPAPAQSPSKAARAVAATVVRTAFGYDTRTDGSAAAAVQRARRWLAPGALSAVETSATSATAAVRHWQRWAGHAAHARVTLRPAGAVQMRGTDTARATFRVTIALRGTHGWSEQTSRRVTVRAVHHDGRWLVDQMMVAPAAA